MTDSLMSSLVAGYSALVIGASGGIGSAMTGQLEMDGNCGKVVRLSRRENGFDIRDEASVQRAAETLRTEEFDLILCATGALTIDGPHESLPPHRSTQNPSSTLVNADNAAAILPYIDA